MLQRKIQLSDLPLYIYVVQKNQLIYPFMWCKTIQLIYLFMCDAKQFRWFISFMKCKKISWFTFLYGAKQFRWFIIFMWCKKNQPIYLFIWCKTIPVIFLFMWCKAIQLIYLFMWSIKVILFTSLCDADENVYFLLLVKQGAIFNIDLTDYWINPDELIDNL